MNGTYNFSSHCANQSYQRKMMGYTHFSITAIEQQPARPLPFDCRYQCGHNVIIVCSLVIQFNGASLSICFAMEAKSWRQSLSCYSFFFSDSEKNVERFLASDKFEVKSIGKWYKNLNGPIRRHCCGLKCSSVNDSIFYNIVYRFVYKYPKRIHTATLNWCVYSLNCF